MIDNDSDDKSSKALKLFLRLDEEVKSMNDDFDPNSSNSSYDSGYIEGLEIAKVFLKEVFDAL